jgi:hypothetical protein
VRSHHHRGAAGERVADAGHRCANARIVGDRARVVLRDVQVRADEHPLSANVDVGKAAKVHRRQMW